MIRDWSWESVKEQRWTGWKSSGRGRAERSASQTCPWIGTSPLLKVRASGSKALPNAQVARIACDFLGQTSRWIRLALDRSCGDDGVPNLRAAISRSIFESRPWAQSESFSGAGCASTRSVASGSQQPASRSARFPDRPSRVALLKRPSMDVASANHRNIAWHIQSRIENRLHGPDCNRIVETKNA